MSPASWPEVAAALMEHPRWLDLPVAGMAPTDAHPTMLGALLLAVLTACPTASIRIEPAECRAIVTTPEWRRVAVSGASPQEVLGRALLVAWGPA